MAVNKKIWVTGQYTNLHSWPEAPKKTYFLRSLHRHVFKWKVKISVAHYDREIEFFIFQARVDKIVAEEITILEDVGSCEVQASIILAGVKKLFPGRSITVSVSEDGENGAEVSND